MLLVAHVPSFVLVKDLNLWEEVGRQGLNAAGGQPSV